MTVTPFPRPSWTNLYILGEKKKPLNNYHNAVVLLENAESIREALAFNAFTRQAELRHEIGDPTVLYNNPLPITDRELGDIQKMMQAMGLTSISFDNVTRSVANTAQNHAYHPVVDYLNSLTWDGQRRNNGWLQTYLGAEDTLYTKHVGAMFLIAMVARVMHPGCKADYMLVLENDQGTLKSQACRTLADPWFSDQLPEITASKEASQHLRGKWLIEIAELHAIYRAESTQLKSFLSRQVEQYRPPFAHLEVEEPRQCLFIGTTNHDNYLKDETGGRRFWPVKCSEILLDELERDRDQLLAEAVVDYSAGNGWWPDPAFEKTDIAPQQQSRFDEDAWTEPVADFLKSRFEVTLMEVAREALGFAKDRLGTADQNRIKRILTTLKWDRSGRNNVGTTVFKPRPVV